MVVGLYSTEWAYIWMLHSTVLLALRAATGSGYIVLLVAHLCQQHLISLLVPCLAHMCPARPAAECTINLPEHNMLWLVPVMRMGATK